MCTPAQPGSLWAVATLPRSFGYLEFFCSFACLLAVSYLVGASWLAVSQQTCDLYTSQLGYPPGGDARCSSLVGAARCPARCRSSGDAHSKAAAGADRVVTICSRWGCPGGAALQEVQAGPEQPLLIGPQETSISLGKIR